MKYVYSQGVFILHLGGIYEYRQNKRIFYWLNRLLGDV